MKITHIMNSINVNGSRARDYLDFMVHQNLVEKVELSERRFNYRITDRGRKILEVVDMVKKATPQEIWCATHR
jgi:predicted transcriptional regulator